MKELIRHIDIIWIIQRIKWMLISLLMILNLAICLLIKLVLNITNYQIKNSFMVFIVMIKYRVYGLVQT